jgi:hypothetical protein
VAPEKKKTGKKKWKKLIKSCASFSSCPWRLKGEKNGAIKAPDLPTRS